MANEVIQFWQINLQKSNKATQELAFRLAHMSANKPFVILIQEPYVHKGRIPLLKQYGNLYFTTTESNMRACILVSPLLNA